MRAMSSASSALRCVRRRTAERRCRAAAGNSRRDIPRHPERNGVKRHWQCERTLPYFPGGPIRVAANRTGNRPGCCGPTSRGGNGRRATYEILQMPRVQMLPGCPDASGKAFHTPCAWTATVRGRRSTPPGRPGRDWRRFSGKCRPGSPERRGTLPPDAPGSSRAEKTAAAARFHADIHDVRPACGRGADFPAYYT